MIESRVLAGAVVGLPISLLCLAYAALRREATVAVFEGSGSDALSPQAATVLVFATATFIGPALGIAAALVYGWVPADVPWLGLALGLATLMSVLALATRMPLTVEKVVLNYAVALILGGALPRLIAA